MSKLPCRLGDIEITEKIADGGAGVVFRGACLKSGRVVAVKVLPESVHEDQIALRRFEQEYQITARFDHPNIVRVLGFCREHRTPYLVMEFAEGCLGTLLERQERLLETEAIPIIVDICRGLRYAHERGVIHRDIKPGNVLLTGSGDAKLTDFGLVKELVNSQELTCSGGGLGTPNYMAPEQFRSAKHAEIRSDIYSVGATLYHVVTGKPPFAGLSPMDAWLHKTEGKLVPPRSLLPGISQRVESAILWSMESKPENRPADLDEWVRELTGHSLLSQADSSPEMKIWHIAFRDPSGRRHTLAKPLADLRRWVQSGVLARATEVVVAPSPKGPFEPLAHFDPIFGEPGDGPPRPPVEADSAASGHRGASRRRRSKKPNADPSRTSDRIIWAVTLLLIPLAALTGWLLSR